MESPYLIVLAIVSGGMIAIQSRVNGELSTKLHNSILASLFSFSTGLITALIITAFNSKIRFGIKLLRNEITLNNFSKWKLLTGMLGGIFVFIQSSLVPIVGVAVFSLSTIAGQTLISILVDLLDITGGGSKPITLRRIISAVLTVFAVYISSYDSNNSALNFKILAVGLIAGTLVGVQRALNGNINSVTTHSYATALINFASGTAILIVLTILTIILKKDFFTKLTTGPWWMYCGGIIGLIYIAATALIVQHLGVLTFTILSVGGQLATSLLLDFANPASFYNSLEFNTLGLILCQAGIIIGYRNEKKG